MRIAKVISEKLAKIIEAEINPVTTYSFNLNFKLDGEDAEKLDKIAKAMSKSRTDLAKFILVNSLDDFLSHLTQLKEKNTAPLQEKNSSLDRNLIEIVTQKLSALNQGETFELKELVGDDWEKIGDHGERNRAGKTFKRLIKNGAIKNVIFVEKKSNNHALYRKT